MYCLSGTLDEQFRLSEMKSKSIQCFLLKKVLLDTGRACPAVPAIFASVEILLRLTCGSLVFLWRSYRRFPALNVFLFVSTSE